MVQTYEEFKAKLPPLPNPISEMLKAQQKHVDGVLNRWVDNPDSWAYGEMDFPELDPDPYVSPRTLRKQRRLANRAKRKSRKANRNARS